LASSGGSDRAMARRIKGEIEVKVWKLLERLE